VITLATPHHGTPLANRILRNRLAERNTHSSAAPFDLFDIFYWGWNSSPHLASNAEEPNRSDLLWDDYDGLFAGVREDLHSDSLETNDSLERLRGLSMGGTRLIVYGGYLPFDGPDAALPELDEPGSSSTSFGGAPSESNNIGQLLRTAAGLLRQQLGKAWNDGFVPLDSALVAGNPQVTERRVFAGYDHQDMMGNRARMAGDLDLRAALLERVALDIAAASAAPAQRPGQRPGRGRWLREYPDERAIPECCREPRF
jgi:hypothetical protein